MDQSVLAAIARFPDRGRAIEVLAAIDEGFRLLCVDLADAEAALGRWKRSRAPMRDERCTEYRVLATGLAEEIVAALDRHSQDSMES